MKTTMSRFQIHDDLTAPEGAVAVLRGALSSGGQLPNFLGVLAGSPAALRADARFRSELRHGKLTLPTLERITRPPRHALPPPVPLPGRARGGAAALSPVAVGGRAAGHVPARGGPRGGLGRRADPGGDSGGHAGALHGHGQRCRRDPGRRILRGIASTRGGIGVSSKLRWRLSRRPAATSTFARTAAP